MADTVPNLNKVTEPGGSVLRRLRATWYLVLGSINMKHGNLRGPPLQCHPPKEIRPSQG